MKKKKNPPKTPYTSLYLTPIFFFNLYYRKEKKLFVITICTFSFSMLSWNNSNYPLSWSKLLSKPSRTFVWSNPSSFCLVAQYHLKKLITLFFGKNLLLLPFLIPHSLQFPSISLDIPFQPPLWVFITLPSATGWHTTELSPEPHSSLMIFP